MEKLHNEQKLTQSDHSQNQYLCSKFIGMLKILTLVVVIGLIYRMFSPSRKQLSDQQPIDQEPDDFIDYEEVE